MRDSSCPERGQGDASRTRGAKLSMSGTLRNLSRRPLETAASLFVQDLLTSSAKEEA